MIIDSETLTQFMAAATLLILTIIAWMNKTRTDSAVTTAAATTEIAKNASVQPVPVASAPAPIVVYAGIDTRQRDAHGNLTTNQINGSQFWMNAGYTGPEPSLETKAHFSDAQLAYENAVRLSKALKEVYGSEKLNPELLALTSK